MPTSTEQNRRPGGRSARNRAAVHQAVEELLLEHGLADVTVAKVAERSGIHATSIYRRWGTLYELLVDVALEATARSVPAADTGSLRGDLARYALDSLHALETPIGTAVAGLLVGLPVTPEGQQDRQEYWHRRLATLEEIFERARARGEHTPSAEDAIEALLAPPYFRRFVTGRPIDEQFALSAVDRLL
jgi:AcrR family transcriptional regulator